MKRWQAGLFIVALITGLLVWKSEPLAMRWFASKVEKTDLAERQRLLREAIEIRLPEVGEGPFPVVLQFHGCAGVRPAFQHQWADIANRAGYAAVIVDSNTPRGFSRQKSLDIICAGKALLGQERAGDVYAAIKIAEADPRLDTDRLVLTAWSHGAWSVMDYLTMDAAKNPPPGFAPQSGSVPEIDGVVVFYPHCGSGALSRFRDWSQEPPVLALIAGQDTIVDADQCISLFEKRKSKGAEIDMTVYPGAEHVFDDPFLEPEWIHWYNEEFFKDAVKRYEAFLTSNDLP